jgi:hypothetical protein
MRGPGMNTGGEMTRPLTFCENTDGRISDNQFVFFRTLKISETEDLEATFREFIRTVINPPDSGPPQAV